MFLILVHSLSGYFPFRIYFNLEIRIEFKWKIQVKHSEHMAHGENGFERFRFVWRGIKHIPHIDKQQMIFPFKIRSLFDGFPWQKATTTTANVECLCFIYEKDKKHYSAT